MVSVVVNHPTTPRHYVQLSKKNVDNILANVESGKRREVITNLREMAHKKLLTPDAVKYIQELQ
ncbi:MAG: hypothetical protein CEN90_138 [Parcubacteria group bacterium Licking1014_17]|nr:MAG: hypothetical protein CEN90_138 [Parcubacteria group bacterium Licking1014_17]